MTPTGLSQKSCCIFPIFKSTFSLAQRWFTLRGRRLGFKVISETDLIQLLKHYFGHVYFEMEWIKSEMFPYLPQLDISRSKGYYFSQETIIGGLLPETTYSVTIAAYTTKGDGARSKSKLVTTTGAGEPCVKWLILLMQQMACELAEILTSGIKALFL